MTAAAAMWPTAVHRHQVARVRRHEDYLTIADRAASRLHPESGIHDGMTQIRRALLVGSAGRYLAMSTGLVTAAVAGRYLTPAEFGLTVLGTSVFGVAEAVRELASPAYLVQRTELTTETVSTIFSVNLIATLVVILIVIGISVPLARIYQMPGLETYIYIMCLSYATGPFVYPIFGLLSRQMAFEKIAALDSATALIGAAVTVASLMLGGGYMSLAWAAVASSASSVLIGIGLWRDCRIYRLSLKEWRAVLSFGVFGSTTALLNTTSDAIFYLVAGKIMNPASIGLLQRSLLLANFPERVLSAAINAVALPSFSQHARQGGNLKSAYLAALGYVTAVEWPALICLAILAEPVVSMLLGPQWSGVVPIMGTVSVALLLNFPTLLNGPLQVASGGIKHAAMVAVAQAAISFTARIVAVPHGALFVAYAIVLVIPVNVLLSLVVLRRRIPFRWSEFGASVWRSAVAAALCAACVLAVVGLGAWDEPISFDRAVVAGAFGTAGWVTGLWLTGHPLWNDIVRLWSIPLGVGSRYLKSVRR